MCCAPIVYMLVYILIGAHIVPLKRCMILRCVKIAISYKYPYIIATAVHYQIYTVVIITTSANQNKIA